MRAAAAWGVQTEFTDASGASVRTDEDVVEAALEALGADEASQPPAPGATFLHHGDALDEPLELVTEDGRTLLLEGRVPLDAPLGYHRCEARRNRPGSVIIAPRRCHLPAGLRQGGWAVQLYALRSRRSWGIGDLGDLLTFGRWAAQRGAGFTLLNPLNATVLSSPIESSPYLPGSRRFRNPLYLRVEDVPGAEVAAAEIAPLAADGRRLNRQQLIQRDAVAALKLRALAAIFAAAPPPQAFDRWRAAQGPPLERFALHATLAEAHGGSWPAWPAALHDPSGTAVAAEARRAAHRVTFHAWLQWLVDQQLAAAAAAVPLMHDLPIGVDGGGVDVWSDQELFARQMHVGAPPDLFNVRGQDWGQPPFNPWRLRAEGYRPYIDLLRASFGHARGLRIDHVMGLFRLYWIPAGGDPRRGVYIRYPHDDLLDILALESVRAGAPVVGEDLGTVEPLVRDQMAARDILSYRLLWFEDAPPSAFPRRAMSAVTTHDLPTVAGIWTGEDVEAQRRLGMEPNEAGAQEMRARLSRVAPAGPEVPLSEVIVAAYQALATSPSMLVTAALDDAAAVTERPNLPGAPDSRPNWCIGLPHPLEELLGQPLTERLAGVLRDR